MKIQNINNTNFNGGFRFRQMPEAAKKLLPDYLPKWRKQIFYDFENVGDVFLVTRDAMDFKVANFIKENNLTCEYYPTINTQCGLDSEEPQKLSELVKTAISLTQDRIKPYRNKLKRESLKKEKPEYMPNKSTINNILSAMPWLVEDRKVDVFLNGITRITDNIKKRRIMISPSDENKVHYVYVDNTAGDFYIKRYAINKEGTIIKEFIDMDDIKPFKNLFMSLLIK